MQIKIKTTYIETGHTYTSRKVMQTETVLPPRQVFILKIDYPLHKPARFVFNSGVDGMTRGDLVRKIRKCYKQVYREEDASTKVKPGNIPGMLNRNPTNGKYGIWGHDIGDLVLCSVNVSDKNVITLGVDS